MNSLIRTVKTLHLPSIKNLAKQITPSLSTLEKCSTQPSEQKISKKEFSRSRSLPPLKILNNHFLNNNYYSKGIICLENNSHSKPTFKIAYKLKRNYSQRSNFRQIDKKKKNTVNRDRICKTPCIKPGVKKPTTIRKLHNLHKSNSLPTQSNFNELYPISPIKALVGLNEEIHSKQYRARILAEQGKNKVTFHYLSENAECRQCLSKNRKRFAEFYRKNNDKMNRFFPVRRNFSTFIKNPQTLTMEQIEEAQLHHPEVVMVKDQNLNSFNKGNTVTLFNLIKLQSCSSKKKFIPTNAFKFEAKKTQDEYEFSTEQEEIKKKAQDPYPLEMFNEDALIADLETAKPLKSSHSAPDFIENDIKLFAIEDELRAIPCGDCGRRSVPPDQDKRSNVTYKEKNKKNKPPKPKKKHRGKAFLINPPPSNDTKNTNLELSDKKICPDCGTGIKKAPCKIKVPKPSDEADDKCVKKKRPHPCEKNNPCNNNYKGLMEDVKTSLQNMFHARKHCPDCGTGKKRAPCKINVPKTKEQDDNCKARKEKPPCYKDNPCNNDYKGLSQRGPKNTTLSSVKNAYNPEIPTAAANTIIPLDLREERKEKIDSSKYLEIFKARQIESKNLKMLQPPKNYKNDKEKEIYFIHPRDNLNQKICDEINEIPTVELAEQSKEMIAKTIKKIIEPIIEKEFLKYEEVKTALERMEKHLTTTLNVLKPMPALEPNRKFPVQFKYPWNDRKHTEIIIENNKNNEMIEPKRPRLDDHREPFPKIKINVPAWRRTEFYKDPNNNLRNNDTEIIISQKYDPCAKTLPKKDYLRKRHGIMKLNSQDNKSGSSGSGQNNNGCKTAEDLLNKSKKTDPFASMSKKEQKNGDTCEKKKDPCEEKKCPPDPCEKKKCPPDPCEKKKCPPDPCEKKKCPPDPCEKKQDQCEEKKCPPDPPCKKQENSDSNCKKPNCNDPIKKSPCDPCKKPETLCKIDPCSSPCAKEEPPCQPPVPKSSCKDDKREEPKGASVECKKFPIKSCNDSCKPVKSCDGESIRKKEIQCPNKCPQSTPMLKQQSLEGRNYGECPGATTPVNCDKKCPEICNVECFQRPCETNPCKDAKKIPTHEDVSCTNKTAKENGMPGMRELIKCGINF